MALIRAKRSQKKLRMAIDGPSGSGKTMSALRFAFALGKKIAVIDTENNSASAYADENMDGVPFEFDVEVLKNYAPTEYTAAIKNIGRLGYDVLVIDGLTQAWAGTGGALEIKDSKGGNSFTAWKDVTPMHTQMIEAILTSPCHVIATMRSKTEYILEEQVNDAGRKTQVPKKVGMAPIQRSGMEYEFDVYGSMEVDTNTIKITKSRCPAMNRQTAVMPGANFIAPLIEWLNTGGPAVPAEPEKPKEPTASEKLRDEFVKRIQNANLETLSGIAKEANTESTKIEKSHLETIIAEGKKRKEVLAKQKTDEQLKQSSDILAQAKEKAGEVLASAKSLETSAATLIYDSLAGQIRNAKEPAEVERIGNVLKNEVSRLDKTQYETLENELKAVGERLNTKSPAA